MADLVFITGLGLFMFILIGWGFFTLPKEEWQMVAALPTKKLGQGQWKGLNLTWYGILSANAYAVGVVIALVLARAAKIEFRALGLVIVLILGVTLPASKMIARIVEKKKATLTVGGAVFAGALTAPWIIVLVNQTLGASLGGALPFDVMLACVSIAYTFGESLGRLACLSFGCCYGKPLSRCSFLTQRIFSRFSLVFTGQTKKVAYASDLAGERLIPIQIITAVLYALSGLAGVWCFLKGMPGAALIETLVITQVWRVVSEFFRADFRGKQRFSIYQVMALFAMVYIGAILWFFPETAAAAPSLEAGILALWDPGVILFVQAVWIFSFFHSGRSAVTDSRICFQVVRENI